MWITTVRQAPNQSLRVIEMNHFLQPELVAGSIQNR